MLRSFLLYLSKADWARHIVTQWAFAKRAAGRFVAGERLEDAIQVVNQLNNLGINATLDRLGEHTTNAEKARRATDEIIEMLTAIEETGIQSNISIKLTQIGIDLDEHLCIENLTCILERARSINNFVRIDMEDSPWVDKTLQLYRLMHSERGFTNTGVVIQSYLYRSEQDIRQLGLEGARVRLCKGAYKESPEIAFPNKRDVDANFDRLARMLLDCSLSAGAPTASSDGKIPPPPAIATHDEQRIQQAKTYAQKIGLPKTALEFQMLNGIRRDLQIQLAEEGYPVRVYVPFGTEWYPYFTRRLAERPANLWFFVSHFFRK